MLSKAELIAFEADIAARFNAGEIRAPVHLSGGNEDALLGIFADVGPADWVLGSWRMHYQCLLKGVPPDELRAAILAGRSIALCFPAHRILSSAIVGGQVPIALGLAWAIKRAGRAERVWCFLGDMGAHAGIVWECLQYAVNFSLPVKWIVEDNGLSVCTETAAAWGGNVPFRGGGIAEIDAYSYKLPWPHAGAGQRVQF